MSDDNNQDPEGQGFLPPEHMKAKIALLLTKAYGNYMKVLELLRNTFVGRDNVEQTQQVIRNVNSLLKFIEDHRKKEKEYFLEQGRIVDRVHKEFSEQFIVARNMVQDKLNLVAKEIEQEQRVERERIQRKQQITDAINQFILDASLKIASASNNEQLLGYERLINLEKANKSKYADQLPLLIERCNDLNAKIKEQKELIRQKERIEAEKKKAEAAGDDEKIDELKAKESLIEDKITENTILVQEEASSNLIQSNMEEETEGIRARRTVWKAELINEKEAMKKSPEMLDISLNTDKVRETINTLKTAGVFKGKTEYIMNGIRFYEEKTF